ncbi:MAG: AAA family ATPase [Roseiflexaceae bacterium]
MIIMLNGSFGVGKTTTAIALVQRLPNAHLFDPEDVGLFARHLTSGLRHDAEETDDFQDIQIWPSLTVSTAHQLYHCYGRSLIIPMTLVKPTVLEPIRQGLSAIAPTFHFCLSASLEIIQQRLHTRGDGPGSWAWRKAAQYVPQLQAPSYARHLDTERHSVSEIVEQILVHSTQ